MGRLSDDIRAFCSPDIAEFIRKYPPGRRTGRYLVDFLSIAHDISETWHASTSAIANACRGFLSQRRSRINGKTQKPVKEVTVQSDYGAIRVYLDRLIKARLLPSDTLLPPLTYASDIFSEKECNVLGYLTLADAIKAPSVEQALQDIKNEINKHRSVILAECRRIVYEGYRLFQTTDRMVETSDFELLIKTEDCLDTRLRSPYGQALSFFSAKHPNGLKNALAYLRNKQDGFFVRKNFPGSHHIYSWSTGRITGHLGIAAEFAVAAMCIIIDELGINVSDLQNAKVQRTSDGEFIVVREDGGITVSTLKPRANAIKERFAPKTNSPSDASPDEITANVALAMLLEMRAFQAQALGSNYLFVLDPCSPEKDPELFRLLHLRRKDAFKAIINRLPEWVKDAAPTMPKIRVGHSLVKWIESDGNVAASSTYLGNSLITALRSYIPPALQEFMHRKRLRDFHTIQLVLSDALKPEDEDYAAGLLQLADLTKILNMHHAGTDDEPASSAIVFLCSPENIELAVSYIEYGDDPKLVNTCKLVINKIEEEGSRQMIKLLAQAKARPFDFTLHEASCDE